MKRTTPSNYAINQPGNGEADASEIKSLGHPPVEKLRYMHRNPVKRGLVSGPEEWRWSSYRFYLLEETGPVRVNEGWAKISFRNRAA